MTSGAVSLPGAILPYWIEGSGGESILVVHGGPDLGSTYLQRPLRNLLKGLARLYFFDQRGCGMSELVEGGYLDGVPGFDDLVTDLEIVRRQLRLASPILVAHSFGGLVALCYALNFESRVRALILIDPDPPWRLAWEEGRRNIARRRTVEDAAWLVEQGEKAKARDPDRYYRVALRACFKNPEDAEKLQIGLTTRKLGQRYATGAAVRNDLGDWDLTLKLRGLHLPTLIVAGSESVFPVDSLAAYAREMPDCTMVTLERAGHFPHCERPCRFRRVVASFLGQLEARHRVRG